MSDRDIVLTRAPSATSWLVWAGLGALVAAVSVVVYVPFASPATVAAVTNSANVVSALAATCLCWLAARAVSDGRARGAWLILAIAFLCSAIAEGVWGYYQSLMQVDVPYPSAADVFYLAYYPLAFVGVLMLVRGGGGGLRRGTTILDAMVFTLGVSGLAWQIIFAPSLSGAEGGLYLALSIAYPAGDLLLLFALCSLFLSWDMRRVQAAALLLLASFTATVVADLGFSWLTLNNEYAAGSPVDPLWTLGYVLAAAAAFSILGVARRAASSGASAAGASNVIDLRHADLLRVLIPYLALPAGALVVILHFRASGTAGNGETLAVVIFALLLLGLVMARQLLTLLENNRLRRSLEALSHDLERRVELRTRELVALNNVSRALSHCLETEEALRVGLGLALTATNAEAGAIWLLQSGGRLDLAATENLDEGARARLEALPKDDMQVRSMLAGRTPTVLDGRALPVLADAVDGLAGDEVRLAVIPLLSRGSVIGTLGLFTRAEGADDESVKELEEAIGAQLGVTVDNAQQYEDTRYLAERDSVTGIRNHRALQQSAEAECQRSLRSGAPLSLVMMDLDGFKLFNDTYGHPSGDDALRQVADLLSSTARDTDVVGRYGGDEFMAILTDTDGGAAVRFCERLRAGLATRPYESAGGDSIPLHLSFGVASFPADGRELNELIALADASLYTSKQSGGDTITLPREADDSSLPSSGMFGVLDGLVTAVDAKDRYTRHHSEDVTTVALKLVQQLELSDETQRTVRVAGLLHDVGKIGVPDRILRKPGRLTEVEYEVVKQHALLSEVIIKEIPNLNEVVEAVGSHHERWDGNGYPRGLKGKAIPLLGRVLAIADAWSAMTTDRPYRSMMTTAKAREELLQNSGSQFDPALVEAFVASLDEESMASADEQKRERVH